MFYYMQKSTGVLFRVTESVQDLDLFTLFGNPTTPKVWTLVIDEGVVVSASTTANAAILGSSNLPSGSILKIVNNGAIIGKGGSALYPSIHINIGLDAFDYSAGLAGGIAVSLLCKTYISNSSGYIFGGGGGGGSCRFRIWNQFVQVDSVTGGGGGAGGGIEVPTTKIGFSPYVISKESTAGTTGILGAGGSGSFGYSEYNSDFYFGGGSGGSYGVNGLSSIVSSEFVERDLIIENAVGGLAGAAISPNGFQLTFLSGLTATRVKGSYN